MKTYGVSRTTTASPDAVWQTWSDPNNWSKWNSGIKSAEVSAPIADGVTGKMTTMRDSTHEVTFHDVRHGSGFSMSMSGPPGANITFTCSIEANGAGSIIAQSVAFAGPMAWLFGAMMGNEMAKHFVPVLDDLARTVETP